MDNKMSKSWKVAVVAHCDVKSQQFVRRTEKIYEEGQNNLSATETQTVSSLMQVNSVTDRASFLDLAF